MFQVAALKAYLANPEAFAVAAPVAVVEEVAEVKAEESETDSDESMGFDMFG